MRTLHIQVSEKVEQKYKKHVVGVIMNMEDEWIQTTDQRKQFKKAVELWVNDNIEQILYNVLNWFLPMGKPFEDEHCEVHDFVSDRYRSDPVMQVALSKLDPERSKYCD